jgi:hypothetical protein
MVFADYYLGELVSVDFGVVFVDYYLRVVDFGVVDFGVVDFGLKKPIFVELVREMVYADSRKIVFVVN